MRGRSLSPLRVAFALHESRRLGSGIAVARLIPLLADFGWSAAVWVPGDGELVDVLRAGGASVAVGPERPFAFSASRVAGGEGRNVLAIRRYLSAFGEFLRDAQPHLVHANTLLSIPEAFRARRYGLPVIVHVHELPTKGLKALAAVQLARLAATSIVAVSPEVASMMGQSTSRVAVATVVNGVPIGVEPADAPRPRASEQPLVIGTVGSASRRKGTDIFVELATRVAANHDRVRFEHVGDWDAEPDAAFLDSLRRQAAAAKPGGVLKLHGAVADVSGIVKDWDIFVLPSRQDPYPLALLEAMALGVPPVATTVGAVPQIVEHGDAGVLVDADSVDALESAVLRLMQEPGLRADIGDRARRAIFRNNSLDTQARSMHAVYLRALTRCWGPPWVSTQAGSV